MGVLLHSNVVVWLWHGPEAPALHWMLVEVLNTKSGFALDTPVLVFVPAIAKVVRIMHATANKDFIMKKAPLKNGGAI